MIAGRLIRMPDGKRDYYFIIRDDSISCCLCLMPLLRKVFNIVGENSKANNALSQIVLRCTTNGNITTIDENTTFISTVITSTMIDLIEI